MPPRHFAVVPAAGVGRRMGAETPKQYLPLRGRPIIAHTLSRLCAHPLIDGVVVAIAPADEWWPSVRIDGTRQPERAPGGEERCHSVLNALELLAGRVAPEDWVLVHDAVRPCVRTGDITRLIETAGAHPVGGLLGVPVKDTMKRTDRDGQVRHTVEREDLWHAHTPQMFRLGALRDAIRAALESGIVVTDEAQAMEQAGAFARLVEGHADNIKITRPEDLRLAGLYLDQQDAEA